jgi:hypothetical protein
LDLAYELEDHSGIDFEEEAQLSRDDLVRFRSDTVHVMESHKMDIMTVIFVKDTPRSRASASASSRAAMRWHTL